MLALVETEDGMMRDTRVLFVPVYLFARADIPAGV
jgi:hypothetical protein